MCSAILDLHHLVFQHGTVLASDIIVQIQNVPQYCTVAGQILYLNDLIVDNSHADGAQRFRRGSNTELRQ